jgi:hypothetical protein
LPILWPKETEHQKKISPYRRKIEKQRKKKRWKKRMKNVNRVEEM